MELTGCWGKSVSNKKTHKKKKNTKHGRERTDLCREANGRESALQKC
jgi:hypothetical protein